MWGLRWFAYRGPNRRLYRVGAAEEELESWSAVGQPRSSWWIVVYALSSVRVVLYVE